MAHDNPTGMETGDTLQFNSVTGTVSADSTRPRSGRYCLRSNPTTTATGYVRYNTIAADGNVGNFNVASGWVRIYFMYLTKPSANDEPIFKCRYAGGDKAEVRIDSAGKLQVYDSALTALGLGATALESGRYYRLELYLTTSAGASAYELKIDGVSELSSTGTFTNNNIANYEIGKTANRNGNTVDFYYDDLCFDSAAAPGEGVVLWAGVRGAGSTFDWSTGTYADVDETPPHDDTATIIFDLTINHVALFTLTTPAIRGTISGFKAIAICNEFTATTSSTAVRIRTQSTNYDNSGRNLTVSFTASQKFYATNPFTGVAWTVDDIRAIEIGLVQIAGAGAAVQCTLVGAEIEFVPAPTPGASMYSRAWP